MRAAPIGGDKNAFPSVYPVQYYGAKGDGASVTDGAITATTTSLTSATHTFTSSDVGKSIVVVGAGTAYVNRGAWAGTTAYAMGDRVTYGGLSWTPQSAHTSAAYFNPDNWSIISTTIRALTTTIASVSAGTAILTDAAVTTVSGATVYYGTDDSTAFQNAVNAAYAAGGGTVYVPVGIYWVRNVYVKTKVVLDVADGTTFRLASPFTNSFFYLRNDAVETPAQGASFISPFCTFDQTGIDPVKGSGTVTNRSVAAVYVIGASDYTIEGVYGLNFSLGNIVQIDPTPAGIQPARGIVRHIYSTGGPYGYGPVQVDSCKQLYCENLSSDMGRALNVETDDPTGGDAARVAENLVAVNLSLAARANPGITNYAFGMVAHSQTIRNVHVTGVQATGGGNGCYVSYVNGAGSLDHWSVRGLYVSGGGTTFGVGINNEFTDAVVDTFYGTGSSNLNLSNSVPLAGFIYAGGMVVRNGRILNGAGDGFASSYWDGTVAPTYSGKMVRFENVVASANGTNGGTYYGMNNQYCSSVKAVNYRASDNPVTEQLPPAALDCVTASGAFRWSRVNPSTTSVAKDTSLRWQRAVLLTADGSAAKVQMQGQSGTGGYPATAGNWYKFLCAAIPYGTIAEAHVSSPGAVLQASMNFFDAGGSQIGSAHNGSTVNMVKGKFVHASILFQAPANTAFVQVLAACQVNSGNQTSGEQWLVVPMSWGPVTSTLAGTTQQSYGVNVAQGMTVALDNCTLSACATGRTNGSGVVLETNSQDPDGLQAVTWGVQSHSSDGVQTIILDTTGLTSAQITALFGTSPPAGTLIVDTVNHYTLSYDGTNWYKSAVGTLIA